MAASATALLLLSRTFWSSTSVHQPLPVVLTVPSMCTTNWWKRFRVGLQQQHSTAQHGTARGGM
jgi:hypothetical protein